MILPIALALAAMQAVAPQADSFPDAYLDPGARALVAQARERRDLVEGRIERYRTVSRSRISIGLRALRRDRMFYRCEAVARVEWNRRDTIRVDLLAAREVIPIVTGEPKAGDGDCGGASFDPTADRLGMALGDGMTMGDSSFLKHPLGPGSERDYRFRSGSTTAMRLADGTMIRLRELEILPRRSEPFLVSGSLWLEDRTHAVVRAVMRLARAFDYDRDYANTPRAGDDDDDEVPGILRPLRADIRYVTIEYGLWDQQWWLPRLMAFEGDAQVGRLFGIPLKMERTYSDYEVDALAPGEPVPEVAGLPADSVCRTDEDEDDDEAEHTVTVSAGSEGADVDHEHRHSCDCREGFCRVVVTTAVVDSVELVHSDLLPESIFEEGDAFITDREMRDILARVESGRRPPWRVSGIDWRTGFRGLDLVRYNRIEGLSIGAGANLDLGRAVVDGTVRVGVADLVPNFELAATRSGAVSRYRLGAYRSLEPVGPARRHMGIGGSLSALLLGRDDGDYYRAWGVEMEREPVSGDRGLTWRLFGELQREARKKTDFHLAGKPGETSFRPNIAADDADQVGVDLRLHARRGADPTGWRGGVSAGLLASTGSYSFGQPMLTLAGAAPLPQGLLGSLEVNAGTTVGDAPLQSLFFLGGASTVRGYGGDSARGETFWTGRAEIGTVKPGVRLIAFSDLGWAGERDAFSIDPLLLSVGGGVSFLDGLLRIDLARPLREGSGWRVEMQVDAGL
ncbi:MAG TPA: hypothetical protein VFZ18_04995 [Longimicrobiaceae bacterium]